MMKKAILLTAIIPFLLIPVFAQTDDSSIPSWVKIIAGSWYKGEVSDTTFKNAMESLIKSNIIEIENPMYTALAEESELVTNLNRQIDELRVEIDEVEESKDILEEEFMKEKSEYQAYWDEQVEFQRLRANQLEDEKNAFEIELMIVKAELENAQAELDKLK